MGIDTVSPRRKPLKSSKDEMDLLSQIQWHIYFGSNERFPNATTYFTLERIKMFSLVWSHFSLRMG